MPIPPHFRSYMEQRWRAEAVQRLCLGLEGEAQVSLRINSRRFAPATLPEGCCGRVPWCPDGYCLSLRPTFTADPLLHAGAYYVQEASSQFVHHVAAWLMATGTVQPRLALDLCAAPGGKSTLLRALLPDECLLLCNEPLRPRAQVLAENMAKWGHQGVVVTCAYADAIATVMRQARRGDALFDLIMADVPCSGEGMFRKEADAVAGWSAAAVAECAARQRAIVADIWPTLRPGGVLLYSTCTFNPEEDEDNVEWICRHLGAKVMPIPVADAWHIDGDLRAPSCEGVSTLMQHTLHPLTATPCTLTAGTLHPDGQHPAPTFLPVCHLLPGTVQGEGFFIAALVKDADSEAIAQPAARPSRRSKEQAAMPLACYLAQALPSLPTDMLDVPPVPAAKAHTTHHAASAPRAHGKGHVGTQPEKNSPTTDTLPVVELTLADAFAYLQHQAIQLPAGTPRGVVQVAFHGMRLGLCNNLGPRANNMYPQAWRIRSSHITPHSLWGN